MYAHILFDWGDTLMEDMPANKGPMHQWPRIRIVPGAATVLAALSQKTPCHLATNAADSTEKEIRKALARAGLDRYISEIFCYRSIGQKKPNAAYFEAVLKKLGAPRAQVLLVGDSLEDDVRGALRSGLEAVWFNRSGGKGPADVKAVETLEALIPLIG